MFFRIKINKWKTSQWTCTSASDIIRIQKIVSERKRMKLSRIFGLMIYIVLLEFIRSKICW